MLGKEASIKKDYGYTWLHKAVRNLDHASFQRLIEETSEQALNEALVTKEPDGFTLLHLAVMYSDTTGFQALYKKADKQTFKKTLETRDRWRHTPLHYAVTNPSIFQMFFEDFEEIREQALALVQEGCGAFPPPLVGAVTFLDPIQFQKLTEILPPKVVRGRSLIHYYYYKHDRYNEDIETILVFLSFVTIYAYLIDSTGNMEKEDFCTLYRQLMKTNNEKNFGFIISQFMTSFYTQKNKFASFV